MFLCAVIYVIVCDVLTNLLKWLLKTCVKIINCSAVMVEEVWMPIRQQWRNSLCSQCDGNGISYFILAVSWKRWYVLHSFWPGKYYMTSAKLVRYDFKCLWSVCCKMMDIKCEASYARCGSVHVIIIHKLVQLHVCLTLAFPIICSSVLFSFQLYPLCCKVLVSNSKTVELNLSP